MSIKKIFFGRYRKFVNSPLTRVYYLLLIFSFLLIIAILLQTFIYQQRLKKKAIETIKKENIIKAKIFEEHTKRTFNVVNQILLDILKDYNKDRAHFNLTQYAKETLIGHSDLLNQISITDQEGKVTQISDKGNLNISTAERNYYKYHKKSISKEMHIDRPILGKVTNKWFIPATIRINNPDGSFAGVVIASVNPYYFTGFFKQVVDGRIFLVNQNGYILASWTDNQSNEMGKDYSKTNAFIMSQYANQGIEISKSIFDNVERVRAFRVIEPYKIVVVVTLEKEIIAGEDRESFLLFLWYSILLILLILIFTYWATRSLQREQRLLNFAIESEEKANTILKTVTEGIVVIRNFKIVYFNPRVLRIFKSDPNYLARKSFLEFVHPDDKEIVFLKYKKQKDKHKVMRFDFRVYQMDKSLIWLHVDTIPIVWQGEKAILACFNDITETKIWAEKEREQYIKMESINYQLQNEIIERKALEEERSKFLNELKSKNLELEKFVYTVSHDLRSPLITIKGFSNFVRKDILNQDIDKANRDLDKVEFSADKMSNLIDDLLELSRAGRVMRAFSNIDMNILINEVLQILQFIILNSEIEIVIDNNLPEVNGDNLKIRQLYQNLIENAIKYKDNEKKCLINIGYSPIDKCFYVKDNGIGIKLEDQAKIYEVFTKLSHESKGSGIGLSIVKRIVELHNGKIWIKESKEKGVCFCFTFSENKSK